MESGSNFLKRRIHIAVVIAFLLLLVLPGSAQKLSPESPPGSIRALIVPRSPDGTPKVPADIVLQTGHVGSVTAMAFSADGKILVSASEDGHVIVWNPQEGMEEARLIGHTGPVRSIVLSGDGQLIASGADDGTIKIWDRKQRLLLRTLSVSGDRVLHLAISPNSKYLMSADSAAPEAGAGAVRLWDLNSGHELAVLEPKSDGLTAVFFTAQRHAAIASAVGDMELHGTVKTFDVPSGRAVHTTPELVRAVTPDGRWLAIQHGQWERATVGVLDALQGNEVAQFSASNGPIAFSPNGEWVANITYANSTVVVRRATTAETLATIRSENWEIERLAVSPDASLVATTGRGGGVQLWKTSDSTLFQSLENRPGSASLAFDWTGDSKTIVTAGTELLYWDIETRRPRRGPVSPTPVFGLTLSSDGNFIATGGHELRILDRRTDKVIREVTGTCDVLPRPAFSPDGKLIAANCRGVVRIWDITTGNERFRSGNYDLLDSGFVSFSPDGRFLIASAGPSHTSLHRLGESAAVSKLAISGGLAAAAFSPDMQWIAVGTWSQMRLNISAGSSPDLTPVAGQRAIIAVHEVATGGQIFSTAGGDWASALAFSEDGRTLLVASGDSNQPGKVLALDSSSGRILRTVVDRVDAQNWAAFSPDRAWLAAISHSPPGSVKLWRLN